MLNNLYIDLVRPNKVINDGSGLFIFSNTPFEFILLHEISSYSGYFLAVLNRIFKVFLEIIVSGFKKSKKSPFATFAPVLHPLEKPLLPEFKTNVKAGNLSENLSSLPSLESLSMIIT